MAITKLENDALSNTVTANVVSMSFGNSSVNTVVTSSGITLSNTVTTQAFAVPLVAGETLAALDAVYVEPALTSGTAGRVYKMDADVLVKSTQAFFAGVALAGASAGANVNIQTSGIVSGFVGLTAGAMYYAGSTAGAITATKPLHPLPVGIAVSTTQLYINIGNKREDEQSENVSAVYGYALGGYSGAYAATGDRITFSTGATAASTVSNLTYTSYYPAAVSDTSVYGYIAGGATNSGVYVTTANRITFATSVTVASTVSNLSQGRQALVGISDGAVYGYTMGGSSGWHVVTAERITFTSGVTAASTVSNLSQARSNLSGLSDGSVYGYAMGGYSGSPGYVAPADRTTFSTGATAASTVSNLSQARANLTGVSDNATYGYTLGGETGASVATADRTTFSTSATAAYTAANLSLARYVMSGVSDGNVYGYALGGTSGTIVTTADRITFSTGATAAYTAANLSQARYGAGCVSDGAV